MGEAEWAWWVIRDRVLRPTQRLLRPLQQGFLRGWDLGWERATSRYMAEQAKRTTKD